MMSVLWYRRYSMLLLAGVLTLGSAGPAATRSTPAGHESAAPAKLFAKVWVAQSDRYCVKVPPTKTIHDAKLFMCLAFIPTQDLKVVYIETIFDGQTMFGGWVGPEQSTFLKGHTYAFGSFWQRPFGKTFHGKSRVYVNVTASAKGAGTSTFSFVQ